MPKGQLYINNSDAYTEWGISLEDEALSALMTPAAMKDYVESESRLQHGKRVIVSRPRLDSRDVMLGFHLSATTRSEFLARYASFCDELAKGSLAIWTEFQPAAEYHCVYNSCTQYSAYASGLAVFSLRLTEPDPTDRAVTVNTSAVTTDDSAASTDTTTSQEAGKA